MDVPARCGGDFVIRTTGDAYNPYIQDLCPQMDSVETIIITSVTGKLRVCQHSNSKRGGTLDCRWRSVDICCLWRGNCCADWRNFLLNSKQAPVGGTSAGLAVLSQFIYTGALGSVTSSQALANPFHRYVTLDRDLFQSALGASFTTRIS